MARRGAVWPLVIVCECNCVWARGYSPVPLPRLSDRAAPHPGRMSQPFGEATRQRSLPLSTIPWPGSGRGVRPRVYAALTKRQSFTATGAVSHVSYSFASAASTPLWAQPCDLEDTPTSYTSFVATPVVMPIAHAWATPRAVDNVTFALRLCAYTCNTRSCCAPRVARVLLIGRKTEHLLLAFLHTNLGQGGRRRRQLGG